MASSGKLLRIIRTNNQELGYLSDKLGLRGKMDLVPIIQSVTSIIDSVRQKGDEAVCLYTEQFDHVSIRPSGFKVSEREISLSLEQIDVALLDTMKKAAENIRSFHEAQRQDDLVIPTDNGGYTKLLNRPLDIVGVYVPGGTAPLPSSVLMNVLPAKAAGVRKIIMCTPPGKDGKVNAAILAAASIAGVDEIYRIGGAQAIAAMAYGTDIIPRVDKVTGPGNIYVNTAKRLVYGQVDIDMFAGPSEILIIADKSANPAYIAADMLSQAEHDPLASAILITDSEALAGLVADEVQVRTEKLSRSETIRQSLSQYGAILVVPDITNAIDFANELAPEHLELMVSKPEQYIDKIKNAGAVFVGLHSPEPLGDYWAGPNHVLPTSGTARFFSPLNTSEFYKKMSIINYTQDDLSAVWTDIVRFAEAESLPAHAESVRVRFEKDQSR